MLSFQPVTDRIRFSADEGLSVERQERYHQTLTVMKRLLWTALAAIAILLVAYLVDLPDTSVLRTHNPETSAIRKFREQQIRERGKKPHSLMVWRNLDQISPNLVHAVVTSEDDTFYRHHGFDFESIKRAAETNWQRRRFAFGGSTLTQQLARTLYLSPRKNLLRKAKEALITRRLESTLSKKRILELYLNVVEWGPQVYGAEAAAQHFFNKPASDLTPEEAISLAAILPSPRRWNPLGETRFMLQRRTVLHDRMVRARFLTPAISSEPATSTMTGVGSPPSDLSEPTESPDDQIPDEPGDD